MAKKLSKTAVRKLWVEALESGEYRQETGQLAKHYSPSKGGTSYCCLGVLCELAVKHGIIPAPSKEAGVYVYADNHLLVPDEVKDWVGLSDTSGTYNDNYSTYTLANMNDVDMDSFAEIAEFIRSKPMNLFV
jgi:hypothetical protein